MQEKSFTTGTGVCRPRPEPVVPGDQEVPAGAISRARISSGSRASCSATSHITTSRA